MTTTTDKMRARVIGLVAKARATDYDAERTTLMEKADELVKKYSLPATLLTDPTPQAPSAARAGRPSYTQPERRYPCRFGCGVFVQHTADEMSACAERKRNETGRDSAYDIPADHDPRRGRFSFDDFFREYTGYQGGGHHERTSYTSREDRQREKAERFREYYGGEKAAPKARATGSHANCDHPATKSARAHCRKMRAMGL